MALVLFQLGFETFEQGECIGRRTGEACKHLAMVELTHLARGTLDDDVAQGHLAIATDGDLHAVRCLAAYAENGGAMKHRGGAG